MEAWWSRSLRRSAIFIVNIYLYRMGSVCYFEYRMGWAILNIERGRGVPRELVKVCAIAASSCHSEQTDFYLSKPRPMPVHVLLVLIHDLILNLTIDKILVSLYLNNMFMFILQLHIT